MIMKRKYVKVVITASCSLVLILAFFMIRELIDHKQVDKQIEESTIKETTPPKKEIPDWAKEYDRRARTEPAEMMVTEYGDFYYAPFPKPFPRDEIANRDIEEEITTDTNQVILKGYYYEKR
ncbi:conserved domain protein [Paenibacillus sp. HGF5]|nr:conserved domain protein [Paenibacillus sp. HGF5]